MLMCWRESCSYNPTLCVIGPLNNKSLRSNLTFHDECCLASTPSCSNWVQPRKLDKLEINNRQHRLSKHMKGNMARTDYKSEEFDITGTEMDSFVSSEGANEVSLVEGVLQIKPWWEQFPKRQVIVLLCFSAFLLCDMDRVS